jgi:hypothetical protein
MTASAEQIAAESDALHELFVRTASKNGRLIVTMKALDYGDACVIEVQFGGGQHPGEPRSYSFADAQQASTFVTEAVEALIYLGCDIHA